MLVLGLTALRPRAACRPAVRMDQGVTAPEDDDAELLKRMAQQRLLGKTETQVRVRCTSRTPLALPPAREPHACSCSPAPRSFSPSIWLRHVGSRRSSRRWSSPRWGSTWSGLGLGLGLANPNPNPNPNPNRNPNQDLSFFDEPAPPAGGGGAASKTLTERQERLLSGKDIQVPAGVPMDSRYPGWG